MGILNWIRGEKKTPTKNLPAPTPVTPPRPPSDVPPIRAPEKKGPDYNETVKTYDTPPKKVVKKVVPTAHPTVQARRQPPEDVTHIFVSSDEYSTVIENANRIRSQLLETEERLQQLGQLRADEEKELLKWQEQLVSLEKKLTYMEAVLEKAGEV